MGSRVSTRCLFSGLTLLGGVPAAWAGGFSFSTVSGSGLQVGSYHTWPQTDAELFWHTPFDGAVILPAFGKSYFYSSPASHRLRGLAILLSEGKWKVQFQL